MLKKLDARLPDCVVIEKSAKTLPVMPDLIRHPENAGLDPASRNVSF